MFTYSTYVYVYLHMYVSTNGCLACSALYTVGIYMNASFLHICIYEYICICICMYIYINVCKYMYMYVCMYICMYVCMYVCIWVYQHMAVSLAQDNIQQVFLRMYDIYTCILITYIHVYTHLYIRSAVLLNQDYILQVII